MEIILWIVGGLVVLGFLQAIGAIQEIITFIIAILLVGGIAALISWAFDWDAGAGFGVGVWVGTGLYGLLCIARIVNPEIEITYYSDGSSEKSSERTKGIVGIIVLIIALFVALFK